MTQKRREKMVMTKSKERNFQFVGGCITDLNFEEFYKELSKSIHMILKPYGFRKRKKFSNLKSDMLFRTQN